MPQPPVVFALEFSSQDVPVSLLEELAERVLRHAGCSVPGAELTDALTRATAGGTTFGGARRCDVQFRAHDRVLDILVSAGGGRIWQTSCALP